MCMYCGWGLSVFLGDLGIWGFGSLGMESVWWLLAGIRESVEV